jgi:hypothetical protein
MNNRGTSGVRLKGGIFGQRLGGRAALRAREFGEVPVLRQPALEIVHKRLRA